MKLQQAWSNLKSNVTALLQTDIQQVNQSQIQQMLTDQLGAGWIDRLMAVRGRLNPSTVEKIVNGASSRTSGELGRLFELAYYISTGPRIGGMLEKRLSAASRVMWDINPGNKDNPTSADAAGFIARYLEDIRFKGFMEQAMDGKLYGVTAFHNVIMQVGNQYVFEDPTENQISQSRWFQERSGDANWGKLFLKNKEGTKLFIDNPDDIHPMQLSVFVWKHKRGYWDTTGLMMRILRLYTLKVWTLVFLAQTVERHGKPFIWTSLSEKQFNDEDFKSKVKTVLKQFGAERWGVFPQGLDIESLDSASGAGTQMHIELLNYCNTEIAVSLLGQNLSTEVQGGSFAAASSHAEVEERLTETDIEWLEEQLNDHFLYWLVKLNYPDLDLEDYPKLSLSPVRDVDVEKVARGYKALSELVDVPVEEIRSKAQSRAPRIKEDADEEATGADRYDEEVVGPSTRRNRQLSDQLLRGLGA